MSATRENLSDAKRALLEKRLRGGQATAALPPTLPPRPVGEPAPLSFSQQRLWFLNQLDPDSPAYNITFGLRLSGDLDLVALHASLNEIVRRHEVLRTTFVLAGEDPIQQIAPAALLPLPVTELGHLAPGARAAEMTRLVHEEADRPFDLAVGPLFRAALLRLDATEHALLLNLHHTIADGWSVALLIGELAALYAAFQAGQPSPLPELPIQYADFAHWQRHWLEKEGGLAQQLAYWTTQLANQPPLLNLPTDRPRPAVQRDEGGLVPFAVPPALATQLRTLARAENATLFMVLLTALDVLLYRLSGQSDLSVGTPIANRQRPELETLLGCFVNTLVLRARLDGRMTARELLAQVRETTLAAYAHQDVPFERLVEALQPQRTLSYSPLFQVQFVYHNQPRGARTLPGLLISEVEFPRTTTKFDLTLSMSEESGGGLAGHIEYNRDLFDAATVERMVGHLLTVLEGIAAEPTCRLEALPLLTEAERRQILGVWRTSDRPYPARCLHDLIATQAARTPDALALCCEGESLSYRALNERANQLAHWLQRQGVGPESRVGIFADRSIEVVVALLAVLKAGAGYVPVDPVTPPDRLAFLLADAGVALLLTQATLRDALPPQPCPLFCLDGDVALLAHEPVINPTSHAGPDNLAYVLFTSGSTGRPKGVAVEHRQIVNYVDGILERVQFPAGASYAVVSTFAADLGNTVIFPALCTGGTLHIIPYERAADPEALADYFSRHRIDCLKIVPSHFDALQTVPVPQQVVPHQRLIFGGEASSWEAIEKIQALRPGCTILNHYGPTETTVGVLTYRVEGAPAHRSATLPLGRPLPNARMVVLDRGGQPVPVGVPGELFIGGRGVTRGYLGRPALTADRFVPDPFGSEPGARLYRTGDLVRWLPDGNLEFLGRGDHQVKIRGYRIELGEIEALLSQHPAVREAVLVVREPSPGDKQLVAYVTTAQDDPRLVGELRGYLRERLPDYMVPGAFVQLPALPLTPNGKVDRAALPAPDATRPDAEAEFTAPRTAEETRIAAIWGEVLGVQRVGIDDNFFDLGGESFKAIRVVRRVGEGVSVMTLFKHPTVRELAAALAPDAPHSEQGILHELTRPVPRGSERLTLVCVPYGGSSAISFRPLAEALPTGYTLLAVEVPGHDFSRREEPLEPIEAVARRVVAEVQARGTGPLALYGHCVGGALTVEIARQLEAAGITVETVFIAGSFPAPRLPGRLLDWVSRLFSNDRLTSDRTYHDFLKSLGGFTDVLDPEELAFVMRNLRHDFNCAQDYYTAAYARTEPPRLNAPIVCIVGDKDRTTEYYEERVREWEYFSPTVTMAVILRAGHFFMKHQAHAVAEVIRRQTEAGRGVVETPVPERPVPTSASERPVAAPSLRAFFQVALGQIVSLVGSGLTSFALGVWVFQRTGSVSTFALISLFALLPGILVLPVAGALVDRWDRRRIMILADSVASLRTLALAGLLALGTLELWHIFIAAAVGSICNAFQRPAYAAAIAQLVPKRYLGHANGIAQLGEAASTTLAPFLAGLLMGVVDLPGVIVVDFVTFLVALVTLLTVRFPDTLFRKREEPLVQEVLGGWRYITERPSLVAMVLFFVASNFLLAIMSVLLTPLALSFASPAVLGTVMAVGGSGLLVGGLLMGVWGGTARRAEGMVAFVALEGLFMLLMGVQPSPLLFSIGLFGFFLCLSLSNGHWQSLIQTKVAFELHGRIFSTNQMLAWAMMPLGYLAAGPLADRLFEPLLALGGPLAGTVGQVIGTGPGRGMGLLVMVIGLLTLLVGIVGFRTRRLRFMEDELPDPYSAPLEEEEPTEVLRFDVRREGVAA